jgi:ferritin-like metal-binding protein YciE
MKENLLRKVYIDELKDLYSAENQLVKALANLAKGATSPELRAGFEGLIRQTKGHAARLAKILEALAESPTGKHCKSMEGLLREVIQMNAEDPEALESGVRLISAAQRVEHYELAGYGSVRTYARMLGENEAALLLEQILNEEKETDAKLTELAETIIIEALELENSTLPEKTFRKYLKKSAAV